MLDCSVEQLPGRFAIDSSRVLGSVSNSNLVKEKKMNCKTLIPALCLTALVTVGCTGARSAGGYYTVHAESFRFFGLTIPGDDQAAAAKLHAEKFPGAPVTTNNSTPADWTSFWGVLNNIFGFSCTQISGPTK